MKKMQSGFTLIEIAIVLVIIGLLLGGILKGSEMITEGKIRSTVNDFNGVTAAYYAYIDRYHIQPGDDNQANTRWPAAILPASSQGNGDGVVNGTYTTTATEAMWFWQHLRAAGLLTGSPLVTTNPTNAEGGILGVQTGNGPGVGTAPTEVLNNGTAGTGITTLMLCSTNLPDKVAGAVDTQLDNGNPSTGSIRAAQQALNAALPVTAYNTAATFPDGAGGNPFTICRAM